MLRDSFGVAVATGTYGVSFGAVSVAQPTPELGRTAFFATAAGCYLLKLLGLSVPERVLGRPMVRRIADLIPVALLAALVAVQVFADGTRLVLDVRLAGLAVAAVALVCRLPFLLVVVLAAATAAGLRLV